MTGGAERDEVVINLTDSFIFGETRANDCPVSGDDCLCTAKYGFMTA